MTPAERNAALAEADERCWKASDAARKASTAVIFAEAALLKAQTKVLNLRAKIYEERLQALIDAHLKSDDHEIRQHGVEMRQRQIEREADRIAQHLATQSMVPVQQSASSNGSKPNDKAAISVFTTVNAAGYARMKDEMERTAERAEAEALKTQDQTLKAQLMEAALQARALANEYALALKAELEVAGEVDAKTGCPAGRV